MRPEQVDRMTLQKACDYAVAKIVEQGKRCIDYTGSCAYGNAEGNHCAVGWLLDDQNEQVMTFQGSAKELKFLAEKYNDWSFLPYLIGDNIDAFGALQGFHDSVTVNKRLEYLKSLSSYINTNKDVYKQWVYTDIENEIEENYL